MHCGNESIDLSVCDKEKSRESSRQEKCVGEMSYMYCEMKLSTIVAVQT